MSREALGKGEPSIGVYDVRNTLIHFHSHHDLASTAVTGITDAGVALLRSNRTELVSITDSWRKPAICAIRDDKLLL